MFVSVLTLDADNLGEGFPDAAGPPRMLANAADTNNSVPGAGLPEDLVSKLLVTIDNPHNPTGPVIDLIELARTGVGRQGSCSRACLLS